METLLGNDIDTAAMWLINGAVVAIPTETVYGLAGNALNEDAVLKIFEAKNRPSFNPLIVHIKSWEEAEKYANNIPSKATALAEKFSPGPLTLLLEKKDVVPDLVTAGSSRVALRVPAHASALTLLQKLPFPLAAPSANPFGYISPTTAQHVYDGLQGKIPYILDGGAATVGLESTIIGFNEYGHVLLYRTGGISAEQIEDSLKEKVITATLLPGENPETAGQLKSHYAPHTPLYVGNINQLKNQFAGKKIATISFTKQYDGIEKTMQFILSGHGTLSEAAKNLFNVLRLIDALHVDVILAEHFPDEGIGRAINDRLGKAQAKNKS